MRNGPRQTETAKKTKNYELPPKVALPLAFANATTRMLTTGPNPRFHPTHSRSIAKAPRRVPRRGHSGNCYGDHDPITHKATQPDCQKIKFPRGILVQGYFGTETTPLSDNKKPLAIHHCKCSVPITDGLPQSQSPRGTQITNHTNNRGSSRIARDKAVHRYENPPT